MAIHLARQRQIQRHQHRRPDNRMKPDNFLAHKMDVRRPIFFKIMVFFIAVSQRRDVVGQCVNPNIDHMLRVKIHLNAPVKRGARYAQILQSRLDKIIDHLV